MKKGLLALAAALMLGSGISDAAESYKIHGQFLDTNWSGIDLTEKNGKWVSEKFTPTTASGQFGVQKFQDGNPPEWWNVTSSQTLTVSNPVTLRVQQNGDGTNVSFQCDVTKSYTLTLDPATKTVSMAEAGAATYPESIYLIGYVNGKGFAPNNGIQMTKTTEGVYTCDATIGNAGDSFGYFSFAEKLGPDGSDASWGKMGTRYGATENNFKLTFTNKTATATIKSGENAFKIDCNKSLKVTVDLKNNTMKAVEKSESEIVISYQIHGQFLNSNWSSIDLTETNGKWVSDAFTPTSATGSFGVRKIQDGVQVEWWSGTSAQTLTVSNPVTVAAGGSTNPNFGCDVNKSYKLTLDPATKTVSMAEAGAATYPESIYLIGHVNGKGFKPNNGIQMTKTGEGVYTCNATIDDSGESGYGYFSFAEKLGPDDTDASWEKMGTRYGATSPDYELHFVNFEDKTVEADIISGQNSFKVLCYKDITVTVDLKNMKMTAVDKSGTTPTITYAVVGSWDTWSTENLIAMEKTGENVYTASFENLAANTQFKIAQVIDGKFDWETNKSYGPEYNGPLTGAQTVPVNINGEATRTWACDNNFLIEKDIKNATITFTYVEGNIYPSYVKVEGTIVDTPQPQTVTYAVVGSWNDWSTENLIAMEKTGENVYTASFENIAANTTFKIAKLVDGKFDWNETGSYGAEYNEQTTEAQNVPVNINGDASNAWFKGYNNFLIEKDLTDATITFTYVEGTDVACLVKVEGTVVETPKELVATINFADYSTYTPDMTTYEWAQDSNGNMKVNANGLELKDKDAIIKFWGVQNDATTECRLYRAADDESSTTYRIYNMKNGGSVPSQINIELLAEKCKINKIEIKTKDSKFPSLPEGALGTLETKSEDKTYTATWTAPTDSAVTLVTLNGRPVKGGAVTLKSVTVTYVISTGVESIVDASEDAPVYYYNLQGVRVENPSNGIFIRVQGNKSQKVMF